MTDEQGAPRSRSTGNGWLLTLTGICGGVGMALVSPAVAWGLWFGRSNDGDGPGESTALVLGVLVPLALAVVLLLVRPSRRIGAGLLVGAVCVDAVVWSWVIASMGS